MTKMIISKQNLLSEQDRLSIIKDIEFELKHNPSQNKNKPLYQTMVNIHEKYVRINKSWRNLLDKISKIFIENKIKNGRFTTCWGMKQSKETNNCYHTHLPNVDGLSREINPEHLSDISIVYYAQNKYPKYGTYIGIGNLHEGVQNSIVIFDASIPHRPSDIPEEVLKEEDRLILATDFKYD